jgi:flagella synthesis protein FlgN
MEQTTRQQLEQIMTRETEAVTALAATLELEHEVLTRRDAARLDEVVATKEGQLEALNALSQERTQLLRAAGFGDDKSGFSAALDADSSGQLRALWESQEEALQKCLRQNQINGKLLDASKQQAQELLSLLLGKEASGQGLYDQSGNTSTSFGRNTSIKV